jgi:hypothetical protein
MSVSYWQDTPETRRRISCDVLIVGAGVAGISTSYWLAKLDPSLRIIIIDKGILGSGASGRNGGFITCGSTEHFSRMTSAYGEDKAEEIWKFTEYNHRLMLEEIGKEKLEEHCEYRNRGSWTLAATEHEIEVIGNTVEKLQSKGVNVEWYNEHFVRDTLRYEGFHGGAFYKRDGEIHPMKYLYYLYHHSELAKPRPLAMGNLEVHGIDYQGDLVEVSATNMKIQANGVVLCTNAWSSQISPWFKDKITPMRGQVITTEPVEAFLEPAYCSFVLDYFRQLVDGRILIGGFRNADAEREVGYSDEINSVIDEKLEGFLNEHFPVLRGKRIDYRWSGVMGFASDGYPMVGSLPSDPQIFYNAGFTAHGLGFAFATGELTARLILEGQDPGIFSGRRFN